MKTILLLALWIASLAFMVFAQWEDGHAAQEPTLTGVIQSIENDEIKLRIEKCDCKALAKKFPQKHLVCEQKPRACIVTVKVD